jgi:hypothetical protein
MLTWFWGLFLNLVVVLFVTNLMIRLRERRRLADETDERQIFGGTARSFGGADFLGAALVIAVNLLGSAIVSLYLVTPAEAANLGDKSETTASVNWMGLLILQLAVIVTNASIIAWRNTTFLDRKWSAATAMLIFVVGLMASVGISIAMSL